MQRGQIDRRTHRHTNIYFYKIEGLKVVLTVLTTSLTNSEGIFTFALFEYFKLYLRCTVFGGRGRLALRKLVSRTWAVVILKFPNFILTYE